ncbi:tRNA (uridine(54)-C5)-methyltransferase TrmA [Thiomicrorhabdus sediminis]|uniref:tRNA/tmRNA (uracil-C(5))-methyltransferase n=1 Tax=Thiomicrorhabdus sediminis TaxID=2580412 RepID=A0A4V1HHK1_9GAMM|nr:tRNA (uridine(54)-C5)-methyltransferase TrmA [Thiomicrorhabdus sediminis]QCU89303.1 tRNA (uridine(54)-C5)-methyltransferase TrmA [Thiomicrorhabdus sediminis]
MLCQTFPQEYEKQLNEKVARLQELVPNLKELTVFESDKSHYRARAEFRVWHEDDATDYIMFDTQTKEKVKIKQCPMALQSIDELMPQLMQAICQQAVLRQRLFQVDFLATLSGQMLVTLIYRKSIKEDQEWLAAANALKQQLPITHIIGRARKEKIVLDNDYVIEQLNVDGKQFTYQQIENSFTQPNAHMAQNMLSWARKVSGFVQTEQGGGDLIELYCGNGNFSIALSDCFNKVLATEISKTSVASAHFNIEANQVDNVTVVKMAAEEISRALQGESFNRMKDVDLASYDFSTIFVDPPRAGLDDLTRKMVCEFDNIIYVSCNPETLAFDLEHILHSHEIVSSALFDQFPYTHHIESGVFLKRKDS